jgi:hypothetical protein
MNTNTTLRNAVYNFAFTGIMQPHRQANEEPPRSLVSRIIPRQK